MHPRSAPPKRSRNSRRLHRASSHLSCYRSFLLCFMGVSLALTALLAVLVARGVSSRTRDFADLPGRRLYSLHQPEVDVGAAAVHVEAAHEDAALIPPEAELLDDAAGGDVGEAVDGGLQDADGDGRHVISDLRDDSDAVAAVHPLEGQAEGINDDEGTTLAQQQQRSALHRRMNAAQKPAMQGPPGLRETLHLVDGAAQLPLRRAGGAAKGAAQGARGEALTAPGRRSTNPHQPDDDAPADGKNFLDLLAQQDSVSDEADAVADEDYANPSPHGPFLAGEGHMAWAQWPILQHTLSMLRLGVTDAAKRALQPWQQDAIAWGDARSPPSPVAVRPDGAAPAATPLPSVAAPRAFDAGIRGPVPRSLLLDMFVADGASRRRGEALAAEIVTDPAWEATLMTAAEAADLADACARAAPPSPSPAPPPAAVGSGVFSGGFSAPSPAARYGATGGGTGTVGSVGGGGAYSAYALAAPATPSPAPSASAGRKPLSSPPPPPPAPTPRVDDATRLRGTVVGLLETYYPQRAWDDGGDGSGGGAAAAAASPPPSPSPPPVSLPNTGGGYGSWGRQQAAAAPVTPAAPSPSAAPAWILGDDSGPTAPWALPLPRELPLRRPFLAHEGRVFLGPAPVLVLGAGAGHIALRLAGALPNSTTVVGLSWGAEDVGSWLQPPAHPQAQFGDDKTGLGGGAPGLVAALRTSFVSSGLGGALLPPSELGASLKQAARATNLWLGSIPPVFRDERQSVDASLAAVDALASLRALGARLQGRLDPGDPEPWGADDGSVVKGGRGGTPAAGAGSGGCEDEGGPGGVSGGASAPKAPGRHASFLLKQGDVAAAPKCTPRAPSPSLFPGRFRLGMLVLGDIGRMADGTALLPHEFESELGQLLRLSRYVAVPPALPPDPFFDFWGTPHALLAAAARAVGLVATTRFAAPPGAPLSATTASAAAANAVVGGQPFTPSAANWYAPPPGSSSPPSDGSGAWSSLVWGGDGGTGAPWGTPFLPQGNSSGGGSGSPSPSSPAAADVGWVIAALQRPEEAEAEAWLYGEAARLIDSGRGFAGGVLGPGEEGAPKPATLNGPPLTPISPYCPWGVAAPGAVPLPRPPSLQLRSARARADSTAALLASPHDAAPWSRVSSLGLPLDALISLLRLSGSDRAGVARGLLGLRAPLGVASSGVGGDAGPGAPSPSAAVYVVGNRLRLALPDGAPAVTRAMGQGRRLLLGCSGGTRHLGLPSACGAVAGGGRGGGGGAAKATPKAVSAEAEAAPGVRSDATGALGGGVGAPASSWAGGASAAAPAAASAASAAAGGGKRGAGNPGKQQLGQEVPIPNDAYGADALAGALGTGARSGSGGTKGAGAKGSKEGLEAGAAAVASAVNSASALSSEGAPPTAAVGNSALKRRAAAAPADDGTAGGVGAAGVAGLPLAPGFSEYGGGPGDGAGRTGPAPERAEPLGGFGRLADELDLESPLAGAPGSGGRAAGAAPALLGASAAVGGGGGVKPGPPLDGDSDDAPTTGLAAPAPLAGKPGSRGAPPATAAGGLAVDYGAPTAPLVVLEEDALALPAAAPLVQPAAPGPVGRKPHSGSALGQQQGGHTAGQKWRAAREAVEAVLGSVDETDAAFEADREAMGEAAGGKFAFAEEAPVAGLLPALPVSPGQAKVGTARLRGAAGAAAAPPAAAAAALGGPLTAEEEGLLPSGPDAAGKGHRPRGGAAGAPAPAGLGAGEGLGVGAVRRLLQLRAAAPKAPSRANPAPAADHPGGGGMLFARTAPAPGQFLDLQDRQDKAAPLDRIGVPVVAQRLPQQQQRQADAKAAAAAAALPLQEAVAAPVPGSPAPAAPSPGSPPEGPLSIPWRAMRPLPRKQQPRVPAASGSGSGGRGSSSGWGPSAAARQRALVESESEAFSDWWAVLQAEGLIFGGSRGTNGPAGAQGGDEGAASVGSGDEGAVLVHGPALALLSTKLARALPHGLIATVAGGTGTDGGASAAAAAAAASHAELLRLLDVHNNLIASGPLSPARVASLLLPVRAGGSGSPAPFRTAVHAAGELGAQLVAAALGAVGEARDSGQGELDPGFLAARILARWGTVLGGLTSLSSDSALLALPPWGRLEAAILALSPAAAAAGEVEGGLDEGAIAVEGPLPWWASGPLRSTAAPGIGSFSAPGAAGELGSGAVTDAPGIGALASLEELLGDAPSQQQQRRRGGRPVPGGSRDAASGGDPFSFEEEAEERVGGLGEGGQVDVEGAGEGGDGTAPAATAATAAAPAAVGRGAVFGRKLLAVGRSRAPARAATVPSAPALRPMGLVQAALSALRAQLTIDAAVEAAGDNGPWSEWGFVDASAPGVRAGEDAPGSGSPGGKRFGRGRAGPSAHSPAHPPAYGAAGYRVQPQSPVHPAPNASGGSGTLLARPSAALISAFGPWEGLFTRVARRQWALHQQQQGAGEGAPALHAAAPTAPSLRLIATGRTRVYARLRLPCSGGSGGTGGLLPPLSGSPSLHTLLGLGVEPGTRARLYRMYLSLPLPAVARAAAASGLRVTPPTPGGGPEYGGGASAPPFSLPPWEVHLVRDTHGSCSGRLAVAVPLPPPSNTDGTPVQGAAGAAGGAPPSLLRAAMRGIAGLVGGAATAPGGAGDQPPAPAPPAPLLQSTHTLFFSGLCLNTESDADGSVDIGGPSPALSPSSDPSYGSSVLVSAMKAAGISDVLAAELSAASAAADAGEADLSSSRPAADARAGEGRREDEGDDLALRELWAALASQLTPVDTATGLSLQGRAGGAARAPESGGSEGLAPGSAAYAHTPGAFSFVEHGSGAGELSLLVSRAFPAATVISLESDAPSTDAHLAAALRAGVRNNAITRAGVSGDTMKALFECPEFFRYQLLTPDLPSLMLGAATAAGASSSGGMGSLGTLLGTMMGLAATSFIRVPPAALLSLAHTTFDDTGAYPVEGDWLEQGGLVGGRERAAPQSLPPCVKVFPPDSAPASSPASLASLLAPGGPLPACRGITLDGSGSPIGLAHLTSGSPARAVARAAGHWALEHHPRPAFDSAELRLLSALVRAPSAAGAVRIVAAPVPAPQDLPTDVDAIAPPGLVPPRAAAATAEAGAGAARWAGPLHPVSLASLHSEAGDDGSGGDGKEAEGEGGRASGGWFTPVLPYPSLSSGLLRIDIVSLTRHVNHHFQSETDGHTRKYTLHVGSNVSAGATIAAAGLWGSSPSGGPTGAYSPMDVGAVYGVLGPGNHPNHGLAVRCSAAEGLQTALPHWAEPPPDPAEPATDAELAAAALLPPSSGGGGSPGAAPSNGKRSSFALVLCPEALAPSALAARSERVLAAAASERLQAAAAAAAASGGAGKRRAGAGGGFSSPAARAAAAAAVSAIAASAPLVVVPGGPSAPVPGVTSILLTRDMDGALIPYDSVHGVTLITVLRLGLLSPLRARAYHAFVALPMYLDMAPWNIVFMGPTLDYIDYDTRDRSFDSLVVHAYEVMEVLFNYKRTLEDFKKCGGKASNPYNFPFVSECVGGTMAGSFTGPCKDSTAPVPCGDGTCRPDFVTCLRSMSMGERGREAVNALAWAGREYGGALGEHGLLGAGGEGAGEDRPPSGSPLLQLSAVVEEARRAEVASLRAQSEGMDAAGLGGKRRRKRVPASSSTADGAEEGEQGAGALPSPAPRRRASLFSLDLEYDATGVPPPRSPGLSPGA